VTLARARPLTAGQPQPALSVATARSAASRDSLLGLFELQLPADQPAQAVLEFAVPGDRRAATGCRIDVDVVTGTMAKKFTARLRELSDELTALHRLELDLSDLNSGRRWGRLGVSHESIGVADVLLQVLQGLALAKDARNLPESADEPLVFFPVLQRERSHV